jgi:ABC-type nitrate/sulfonate/bicarbonate transport system ATPase subunit
MVAKFYAKPKRRYQVYHKDSVHFDWVTAEHNVQHPHDAHQLEENQKYANTQD